MRKGLKLISNFDSTRQIELEEELWTRSTDTRILFYAIYMTIKGEELLEERIYNSIKDLEVFPNLIKFNLDTRLSGQ